MSEVKRIRISLEDFLYAHDLSDSVEEVAERTGLGVLSVVQRAAKYRKMGINLKKYARKPGGGGHRFDVSEANAILERIRNGQNVVVDGN